MESIVVLSDEQIKSLVEDDLQYMAKLDVLDKMVENLKETTEYEELRYRLSELQKDFVRTQLWKCLCL